MHCEANVTNYKGDLGELLKKYSDLFIPLETGRACVKKYFLFEGMGEESYNVMVSKVNISFTDYNVILTVMGPREDKTKEIMQTLLDKLEIETRPAPDALKENFKQILKFFKK